MFRNMPRHKRLKTLTPMHRERLAADLVKLHSCLIDAMISVAPASDDYRAVSRLHDSLIATYREVLGDDPPWMKMTVR